MGPFYPTKQQGLGFFPLSPTLKPTRCSALKIIIKSRVGGGDVGQWEGNVSRMKWNCFHCRNWKLLELSTMNVSHFHSPLAGSQLHGTFCFKCTTVISATSRRQSTRFFSASPHPTCLSHSCIRYQHILGATGQGTKKAFLTKSFAAGVRMAGVGKQRCWRVNRDCLVSNCPAQGECK